MLLLVVFLERESRDNVHGLEFLEEQFAGVGDLERRHLARGLAVVAPGRETNK